MNCRIERRPVDATIKLGAFPSKRVVRVESNFSRLVVTFLKKNDQKENENVKNLPERVSKNGFQK